MARGDNPNSRKNLIPLNKRTKKEQRKIQTKGGKNSGKSRQNDIVFSHAVKLGLLTDKVDSHGNKLLRFVSIVNALLERAERGDIKAIKLILKLLGQMPSDKVEQMVISPGADVDMQRIRALRKMLQDDK